MKHSSLGKFNYSLRPAKTIERKMLCETFARLARIAPLVDYRYIGFGSIEFCDFRLFHERLGIDQMISIEGRKDAKSRVLFNQPHTCIKILWGLSHEVLPALQWNTRSIVWLDYDSALDKQKLDDISLITSAICSGSILLVTLPVDPGDPSDPNIVKQRLQSLQDRVGPKKVPSSIEAKNLSKWGLAKANREIVHNEILQVLNARNGPLPKEKKIVYQQLFNFHYADGSKMLSVGGIYLDGVDNNVLAVNESFRDLDYIMTGDDAFLIETPVLTWREMRLLDKLLPSNRKISVNWLPEEHLERYRKMYRYFPNYTEVEA